MEVKHYPISKEDPRYELVENVKSALRAIPMHFSSTINIEGMAATDLFAMNTLLGGAIENQAVAALNEMRTVWDPKDKFFNYEFRRYAESFPDVRLESNEDDTPLMGIELKGWYLLAKEEEPSFRFTASADAMTEYDLIAVFPWSLSNVISGTPILYSPFIEQGKYAADRRTHYWENRSEKAKPVVHPKTHPYPPARAKCSDKVTDDPGGNFGRIARIEGLMDDWVSATMETNLAGIPAKWWVNFLKIFKDTKAKEPLQVSFAKLSEKIGKNDSWADDVANHIAAILKL